VVGGGQNGLRCAVVLMSIAGGCGGAGPAPVSASPAAPVRAESAPATAPTPAEWTVHVVQRPALRIALPPEWREVSPEVSRQQLARFWPSTIGDARADVRTMMELLDSGRVRFMAVGPSAIRPWMASAMLIIETGDVSLDAAAARSSQRFVTKPVTHDMAPVTLPLGRAMRVISTGNPSGAAPTERVEYILRLPDGATLTLMGTSHEGDTPFIDIMETMARSLSFDDR
jgi:hypothetical protein